MQLYTSCVYIKLRSVLGVCMTAYLLVSVLYILTVHRIYTLLTYRFQYADYLTDSSASESIVYTISTTWAFHIIFQRTNLQYLI